MNIQGNIQCIGEKVYLIPSASNSRGMIFIPDYLAEHSTMCKVASVGNKVSHYIKPNDIVLCEKHFSDRQNLKVANGFMCDQKRIFAVLRKGIIYPIGRKILIRRDISDEMTEGGILIPENERYQSLFGTVIRWGLFRGRPKIPVVPGDRIRLTQWEAHMMDIELPDGGYGLIVNEDDLLYQILD